MAEPSSDKVLEALRVSLKETERLREQNRRLASAAREPIAIVAMSCRFPGGVAAPEALWDLLVNDRDAVAGFPTDRGWDLDRLYQADPAHAGTESSRAGGFLRDVSGFDPGFFGISPREAQAMDPQQRLLLEVCWEAFERAGIDPVSLRGSQTGIFTGAASSEYHEGLSATSAGYRMTGNAGSVISGRVSYALGLEGPAVTVDTACSSSLVALHLAAQSLRTGESSLALAGGVSVIATPGRFIEFSHQQSLAPDGRCKPFSATADGVGWGEGAGMLLLERLSDAHRRGHPVLAVIRGSAVNQDGASNGLTAPNGPSQQRVIRAALARAGVAAGQVDAVEAHGTGTRLGDPIEAQALLATYGKGRPEGDPLWLGSIKSNIGHTQAAAGVAGVMKIVLALQHQTLPSTLHVAEPTPEVDWSAGAVRLLTEPRPWPAGDRPRRAGVSSFGISGTNAHSIIEEAPTRPAAAFVAAEPESGPAPWVLSARTARALRGQAGRLREFALARPELDPVDVGFSLASGRALLEHRAVVLGEDRAALLAALAAGEPDTGVVAGPGVPGVARVGFVFAGQGSQRAGMGRELHERYPVFAAAFDETRALVEAELGVSVEVAADTIDQTMYAQANLLVLQVALVRLLESWGVTPDAVAGHSVGEVAAAYTSGVLSLEDACRLVAARGRLMQALPEGGAMASIAASEAEVLAAGLPEGVSIAAVNAPGSVVVSGDELGVDAVAAVWSQRARRLRVSHAFHSPRMDPVLDELAGLGLEVSAPRLVWASTLTGRVLTGVEPDYWARQARGAVRYADAVATLAERGVTVFVEIGPDATLSVLGEQALPAPWRASFVPLLNRDRPEPAALLGGVARAFVHGARVDWAGLLPGRRVDLPTYPFQHERYWPEADELAAVAGGETFAGEARFWSAVDGGDAGVVSAVLGAPPEQSRAWDAVLPLLALWRRRQRRQQVVRQWRYRESWERISEPAGRLSGTWLLVVPEDEPHLSYVEGLSAHGARVVSMPVGDGDIDRERLAALLTPAVAAVGGEVAGVVSLLAFREAPVAGFPAVTTGVALTQALVQAWSDAQVAAPLWAITGDAVGAGPGDPVTGAAQAQVWGLGRVAALEYADRWGGLIDLPGTPDAAAVARLCGVLADAGEDQVAIRPDGVYGRRLERAPSDIGGDVWVPRGTVLVTGGTGAVGGHVARWLAGAGAEHVVLASRSGAAADVAARVAELAATGVRVTVAACDVADRAAVVALLTGLGAGLTGIVHTSGVGQFALLRDTDLTELSSVLAAKVAGARHLDELTADRELDAFVVFSSVAATWGSAGQPAYAAGNAFLDALVQRRRARGLVGTSVAWGRWGGAGMGAGVAGEQLQRRGLSPMAPELAVAAMVAAVGAGHSVLTVADVDWARWAPLFVLNRPSPLLAGLGEVAAVLAEAQQAPAAGVLAGRLAGLSAGAQARLVLDLVRGAAAAVLGHSGAGMIEATRPFRDLGFDSLTAVEFRDRLATQTGMRLPATVVFDHPTPQALAEHLRTRALGLSTEITAPVTGVVADGEPIAIVSMACRFPGGVSSPEELWDLVLGERDGIGGFPTDRGWDLQRLFDPDPDHQGTSYATAGGFLPAAADFDAGLFGISPREALAMDPQQRQLLEISWEAFERAGIDPGSLRGTPTGVYIGAGASGYGALNSGDQGLEGYRLTGGVSAVISGRIAYAFGLEGPAVTLDTACSSSLVAMHLASQALRSGECNLALAGGVAVIDSPAVFVEFSRQRGLASDGRCKSFAEAADGTGWAEGAGLVLLERLSDAERNGHEVLAVIRGSAVNSDGASNGLTAPNGPSQQRVIRAALASARLQPGDVDAVEAHGTGTTLGDPIEAQALLATYGQGRAAGHPLWLGSVKSNIGHTQAAAGAAGVIKMVLALRHGMLPASLHIDRPTSEVDWNAGGVELLTTGTPWPENDRPRRAGVSAFGVSGTNAHTILEQAPRLSVEDAPRPAPPAAVVPWVLSSRTATGLLAQAERLRGFLSGHPGPDPADVGFSLATGRAALEHRAVVLGGDRPALLAGLTGLVAGRPGAGVVTAEAGRPGGVVFVFPGQGAQWAGMGRELAASSPVFAERLADCVRALEPHVDWSPADVLAGADGAPGLDRVDVVQPMLWAVLVSLAALWESAGIQPDAVVGHSQGEIAAACVAGILTLDDAAAVVALRAKALRALAGGGGMLSVADRAENVARQLEAGAGRLSVAAVNGPGATVVSGEPAALREFAERLTADGVRVRMLPVDYASHSPQVESIRAEVLAALAGVAPRPARIPMVSAMTGQPLAGPEADAGYWYESLRAPVQFASAVRALAGSGHGVFLELSPHPVLVAALTDTLEDTPAVIGGTLRRDDGGMRRFLTSLAEVWARGVPVDWPALLPSGRRVGLPTYAFQHQRYWPQPVAPTGPAAAGQHGDDRFWTAVEAGDPAALAGILDLPEHRETLGHLLPALSSWRHRQRERAEVESWRYRIIWKQAADNPGSPVLRGTWLALVPTGTLAAETEALIDDCLRALRTYGADVVVVEAGAPDADRAVLAERIGRAVTADDRVSGVVSLLGVDETVRPGQPDVPAGLALTLALIQALGDAAVEAPAWLLTRGAVGTGPADRPAGPLQAPVWGLGRVAGMEHPDRLAGLIDLPPELDERAATRLAAVLCGTGDRVGEREVAIREAGVLVRRMVRARLGDRPAEPWTPRDTVLVTGGTGAIGRHVARWLAGRCAGHIVLTSRSGPAGPSVAGLAAELATAGSRVTVTACDLADRADAGRLLTTIAVQGPPLRAVLHAAGVLDDGVLDALTPNRLAGVLAAKASGARHLDELTAGLDLDAFVLFASVSGVLGSPGQGNYAAANAYLDALAENRAARGLPATSVAWGPWAEGGLADTDVVGRRIRRGGMPAMAPAPAVAALAQALDRRETSLVVVDVDWAQFVAALGSAGAASLIADLPEAAQQLAAGTRGAAAGPATPLAQRLAGVARDEQDRILLDLVRAEAAAVLGHDSVEPIGARRAFRDLGFDSLTAVELRNRLRAATGLRLPTTLVFDYPAPTVLAEFLREQLTDGSAGPTTPAPAAPAAGGEPIAIVAMSCRYPGGAGSPEELWDLVAAGTDGITEFPADRGWDVDRLYHPDPEHAGTTYAKEGGFLHDAGDFDAGFFGISPREALAMDPQQRLLLETAQEAFERARIDPAGLRGSRTGVFVGGATSGYGAGLGDDESGSEGHLVTGGATSVMSGRLSYTFGLEGPSVSVDTACSSSLVALHLACQAIRAGECDMALAGGVTVMSLPVAFIDFSRQRVLSPDGRCKPFAAAADGIGWAEGAGMLLVERLSDAHRLGHPVLAVVRGSAVNSDGASNGLTAPNGPSQQRVIRAALAGARLGTADVDVVEAHGTGTRLGDPIEAQALLATYGQDRPDDRPLWLGSVKSNIGHAQGAAGAAGIIKMVMAMRHGVLPRTLNVDEPSPEVDWSAGAVRLLTEPVPWTGADHPRRAGVSAFGISGTNAHVILEEAPAPAAAAEPAPVPEPVLRSATVPWIVSGRTAAALRAQAERVREHLAAGPGFDPAEVAYSLAATRTPHEYRAVVVGEDPQRLLDGLAAVAADRPAPGVVRAGSAAGEADRLVFVFPGQGSQWPGMARELTEISPVFADRLRACERALAPYLDWSPADVLADRPGAPSLERSDVVQPVLWAVMVSLAALWRAAGVTPAAVVGHSQGEIAAACVAGVLSLDDAARVVALRSRALARLSAAGGMMSVVLPADQVRPMLGQWAGRLSVAAVNGPTTTVVSGDTGALTELEARLSARRVMRWWVPGVNFIAHAAQVDDLAEVVLDCLRPVRPQPATIPFYSTVECRWMDGAELDADYWFANLRRTVRFAEAVEGLSAAGHGVFVEVSPHPLLTAGIRDTVEAAGRPAPVVTGTLHRDDGGARRFWSALAELSVHGVRCDWATLLAGPGRRRIALPTYAFQRRLLWPKVPERKTAGPNRADGRSSAENRFWAAVEGGDLSSLSATLATGNDLSDPLGAVLPALSAWRRRDRDSEVQEAWRYRLTWKPITDPAPAARDGSWLLVLPAAGADRELADNCRRMLGGDTRVTVVEVDATAADREIYAERIRTAVTTAPAGVLSLLAFAEPAGRPESAGRLAATVVLVQALGDAGLDARLWVATRGAVATGSGDAPIDPAMTQLWGLGRVVALEHPDRWGGLIDLPETLDERAQARLRAVLGGIGEDQIALRGAGLRVRRLTRALRGRRGEPWTPRGTVLITGGTGAVAGHLARRLARSGAERIVLAGRSGPAASGVAARAAELAAAGVRVEVTACDVARRAQVAGVLARIAATGPALTAVVHTAGVPQVTLVEAAGRADLDAVFAAKVGGAVHLDELTADLELDVFVLFSSVAATWGGGGQGGYAAANAHLEGLAQRRHARGLPATSVAWGLWGGGGMGAGEGGDQLQRRGLRVLEPDLAAGALMRAVAEGEPVNTVVDVDWARFAPPFTLGRPSPLLGDLPEVAAALAVDETPAVAGSASALAERLAGVHRADHGRVIVELIRAEAAAVLGHVSPAEIEVQRAFRDLGFDSLTAVLLRDRLSRVTGLRLPATLVFDHPTMTVLADFLLGQVTGGPSGPAVADEVVAAADEPIAIVAMSCRYPGGVGGPEDLWTLVEGQVDAVSGFPVNRGWDLEGLYNPDPGNSGTSYVQSGGFIYSAGDFDPGFFGISPREALAMDPQQRLLLETSWEAIERAGIDPASLRGSRTGVFAGTTSTAYGAGLPEEAGGYLLTGTSTSVITGRVSYVLGLEGPAVSVDTACSSSLVALHLAAQALRAGECTLALAGGVTVMATPGLFVEFSRQRGLAADGRCKAFAAAADGTGWGEGAGMLLVERLSDAQRNGHPILAVLRGSAVNQDGASNGLTAPNGPSQQRVIQAALAGARLRPTDVDAVEAHGTGTRLGDPIEAQALLATYGQGRPDDRPVWLGSVKSNIGHTQAAAGVAGVIKMVMAMRHGVLPSTLHVDEPTPQVDWSAGAVRLLTGPLAWPRTEDRPRRAGVSAFGISGTNAHVVLEEAPARPGDPEPAVVDGPVPWVLSARGAEGLRGQAGRLRDFLLARPGLNPVDVGYSLATGRSALPNRAVLLGADRDTLLAGLAMGEPSPEVIVGPGTPGPVRVGFVFAGQGSQRSGMGRDLYERYPVFAEAFDQTRALVEAELGVSVEVAADTIDQTMYAQANLFVLQVSLVRLLASWGVTPDAVAGHSVGEVAAAYTSGVLSLEDACRLVVARGRLMQGLPEGGAMASIAASEAEVVAAGLPEGVSIAAVNGPGSVVVSGDEPGVDAVVAAWSQERRVRRLRVSHAFHSPRMDPVLDGLAGLSLEVSAPRLLWASTLTGEVLAEVGPDYWARQARGAVRYADAVSALAERGVSVFVEIGPDATLSVLGEQAVDAVFVPLLKRDDDETATVVRGLAQAYVHGVSVDWAALVPGRRVDLPTYAFQHRLFWPSGTGPVEAVPGSAGEQRFWAAIDGGDVAALSATLAVDPDQSWRSVVPLLSTWRRRESERLAIDDWRYREEWRPLSDQAGHPAGTWLLLTTGDAPWCAEALADGGAETVEVRVGAEETDAETMAAALRAAIPETGVAGVLSLLSHDETPLAEHPSVTRGLALTLALVQAMDTADVTAPLWLLTREAVAATARDEVAGAVQAQAYGLGRVVAQELPDRWGGTIDLPARVDRLAQARLRAALTGYADEDLVAIRPDGLYGRRLVRAPRGVRRPGGWTPSGTVLVTGGTGAIGGHVADWLARGGAEHVVLASRSGPGAASAARAAARMAESGVAVTVASCDAADRDAVAGLLAGLAAGETPLTAVLHTAGVLDDGVLAGLDPSRLATVLSAKAASAQHLDELTRDLDLEAFVLFASVSGTLGSAGQGNYAAANAYLDALAGQRRARGRRALSVSWGAWAEGGMAQSAVVGQRLRRHGIAEMAPELALRALKQAIEYDETTLVVVDWGHINSNLRGASSSVPLVSELLAGEPGAGTATTETPDEASALVRQLAALSGAEQTRTVSRLVREAAAGVLGHSSTEAIENRRAFRDLGFDSLTSVELRNQLGAATGLRLAATLAFDYPTPADLTEFLRVRLVGERDTADEVTTAVATDEPIAIVAMSCRMPGGVTSPEELWEVLAAGRDGLSEFPADRGWDLEALFDPDPANPGTSYVREGGFLRDAGDFDPGFFGISPREALAMDPQQRLLLEISWEALERAGIDPVSLRGSRTGVFAGTNGQDYAGLLAVAVQDMEGHAGVGNAASVVSGRVSYALGLEGPAVSVDTACSSSLVALHLAAQALRSGECTLALAGGVTVMSTPSTFVDFSRQRGLATDGRCKAFAAAADGTGWGEGAGMLLVERLSDAQRNGHPILAVVRGSAVNQDGASNGLTAPNGPSQQRVIRAALASAGLGTGDVDAVEAHGTGTTLGDPIEAQALLATYGQGRPEDRPVWLGSIKSNIGHTQAAAGVAGVIKMVLAMRNGLLPSTLHVDEPSHQVDWSAGAVRLLTEAVAWPSGDRPRRAGVSSFGVSGTNAHTILEEAPASPAEAEPAPEPAPEPRPAAVSLVVSARGEAALRGQAARLGAHLAARPEADLADVAYSLRGRAALEHRAAVVGGTRDELLSGLRALAAGEPAGSLVQAQAGDPGRVAFVFPGQGSQWLGMGRELMASSPVFAARMAECGQALRPFVDWSLTEVIAGAGPDLDRVDVVQPVLWAVMVSLAAVWQDAGVTPDAVVGHSQGEIAAACVAGILSLADGAAVVALRSKALRALAGGGGMMSVAEPASVVRERLEAFAGRLSVAAVNGPSSTVVSGEVEALQELAALVQRSRILPVDYASHGPQVEAIREQVIAALDGLAPRAGQVAMVSALTGELIAGPELDAGYWYASLRAPVEFDRAVQVLAETGHGVFVEVSPHPVLTTAIGERAADAVVTGTLRRDDGGLPRLLASLSATWVRGLTIEWAAVVPGGRRIDLPTYAFQRQHYWPQLTMRGGDVTAAGLADAGHPMLGAAVELADGQGALFTGRLSLRSHPWLADHAVLGTVLLPGTAFVELAIRAGDQAGYGRLEELALEAPLTIAEDGAVDLQVTVGAPGDTGFCPVAVYSRAARATGQTWTRHASGQLAAVDPATDHPALADLAAWPPAGAEPVPVDGLYEGLAAQGYGYGPLFRGLRAAWHREGVIFAEVEPAEEQAALRAFGLHPALLDAALHAAGLGAPTGDPVAAPDSTGPMLPFVWRGVTVHATGATGLRIRLIRSADGTVSLAGADGSGRPVVTVDSLVSRPVSAGQLDAARGGHHEALLGVDWVRVATETAPPAGRWRTVGADPLALTAALTGVGADVEDCADLTALAAEIEAGATAPDLVLATVRAPAGEITEAVRSISYDALQLIQQWLSDDRFGAARLVVVTRAAMVAGASDGAPDLAGAAVWGLIRSAQRENPGRLILVDLDDEAASPRMLAAAVATGEDQLAVRGGLLHAPRLARRAATGAEEEFRFDPAGTVLVTGASGTLGGLVARHLVRRHGARTMLLLSRRGCSAEGAAALQADLSALGAKTQLTACDVADRDALAAVLAAVPAEHPLTVVVHCAGVLDDGVIGSLTPQRIDRVMRPKVDAAWNLHELTAGTDLAAFVLFSSAAGTLGATGQGNYAAANGFLDALAQSRHSAGRPATSLAWGLWDQTSTMTGTLDDLDVRRMSRAGITAMTNGQGLALFDLALADGGAALVPMRVDTAVLRAAAERGELAGMFRGLVRTPVRRAQDGSATAGEQELRRRLAVGSDQEQRVILLKVVLGQVAAVLAFPSAEAVDARRGFRDLGFDSLTAIELRNRLNAATGLNLSATLVFDYPTPVALVGHLLDRLDTGRADLGTAVFAEVDKLEQFVPAVAGDAAARNGVLARLRALVSVLESGADTGNTDLDTATADDIFSILDNEIGS